MKNKKPTRKLKLGADTLRHLSTELEMVRGGALNLSDGTCYTQCILRSCKPV